MSDDNPAIGGQIARIGLIILASIGALFAIGVTAGLIGAHVSRGGEVGIRLIALVAGAVLLAAGCLWGAWLASRAMHRAAGTPTTRERRNRTVLILCGAMGAAMGMVLAMAGPSPFNPFSNEPMSPLLAIGLAFPIAVLLPFISIYWHRHAADEQEIAAYSKGALIGIYTYFIGAPTWWLLWRGGLLPEPNDIIIYFVTIYVTGGIWLWAKYR